MFQKAIAVLLTAALLLPGVAAASGPTGFPRFFERGNEICVQMLDSDNTIQEHCRPADGGTLELRQVELGSSLPFRGTWTNDPAATARRHAASYGDNSRFGTGLALGIFLGLIGTVVAGVVANNSSVATPPPHPSYDSTQAFQYERAYAEEVRADRTGSAIAGGLVGTALIVGLVLLVASSE